MGNVVAAHSSALEAEGHPYGLISMQKNQNNSNLDSVSQKSKSGESQESTNTKQNEIIFRILGLNVCGLFSKLNLSILEDYMSTFEIICLSETKTDTSDELNAEIPGYMHIFRHCVKHARKSGGIALYFKEKYSPHIKPLKGNDHEYALWSKLDKEVFGIELIIGAIYIPPVNSSYSHGDEFDILCHDIIDLHAEYDLPFLLIGDFNARSGTQKDYVSLDKHITENTNVPEEVNETFYNEVDMENLGILPQRANKDTKCDNNGCKLLDLCKSTGLVIVNGRIGCDKKIGSTTCKGASTVDYVLASPTIFPYISDMLVDIFDPLLSDVHNPICLTIKKEPNIPKQAQAEMPTENPSRKQSEHAPKFKPLWEASKAMAFKSNFQADQITKLTSLIDDLGSTPIDKDKIDLIATGIHNIFSQAGCQAGMMKQLPAHKNRKVKIKRSSPGKPWFDLECEQKGKDFFRAKSKFQKNKLSNHKADLLQKSKILKQTLKYAQHRYHSGLHKRLRELKKAKPKDYWDILNEACEKKPKESPVDANTFVEHFRELNINAHTATQQEPNEQDADLDSTSLNTPFTEQEVRKQIQRLKNGKACGIDAIVNEFIKSSPLEMVALLVKFFNLILISETMPSNWSIGVIIPIFKNKGTQTDPGNYRGITLLSCLGKLFTGLINQRLSKFLDSNGLLGEEQAGFREGYSTMDHTLTLNLIIEFLLSKHKRLYCAFIDYHKAFDTVDRTHLWTKLFSTGIHGRIFNVVKSIYKEAQSCVRHNGEVSQLFPCNNGVRQGDNLSPLLFSIYLNDLQVFLSKQCKGIVIENKGAEFAHYVQLFTLLYADDTILLGESAQDLQVALDSLYSYCERWNLKVNENKTKVVVFSRGKVRKVPEWRFGPHTITTQYDYTYLGVSFNYNGLFEKAMGKQVTQAKRALFSLVAKFRKLNLPLDIQCHLVDSCITPILLYGSEVWGSANIKQVEVFHNQLCKQILHLGRKTANCIPLGELGRFTMAHL